MREPFLNIADARRRAERVLPRVVFDYVDGGAEDEVTMAENVSAFRQLAFSPRMAMGAGTPAVSVRLFGEHLRVPVVLAPCGLVTAMHPDGAVGVARAAGSRGTVAILSSVAGAPLEDVASETRGPLWFQLYAAGGRPDAEKLVERAAGAGYKALVVTVDTPVIGRRERDLRNGIDPPMRMTARGAVRLGPQVLARPLWVWRMARVGVRVLGRPGHASEVVPDGPTILQTTKIASPFRWSDIEWLRGIWRGPLVVKGLLSADDASRAVSCGADGVVVSNHGGRQLDGAPATMRVLPEIASAVGNEAEVLLDGGVRRGSDVVKAIALGARAVLIGRRPYLYGLAASGRPGVERVLDVLRDEMLRTMSLLGCMTVDSLDRSWVRHSSSASDGWESSKSPII